MIIDVLQLIAGTTLAGIVMVFSAVNYVLPDEITDAIVWFFGFGNYFKGIFPVATLYSAVVTVILVWVTLYGLRLFLHLLSLIPFVGKKAELHHGKKGK